MESGTNTARFHQKVFLRIYVILSIKTVYVLKCYCVICEVLPNHPWLQRLYISVQFSHTVMSNCLWFYGLQHARLPLSITNFWSLLKLISIYLVMPSNHLILCHPLLLTSIFPSIRVFSSDKTWSTGEGNGKPLHYSCLENPMNSMRKGQTKSNI